MKDESELMKKWDKGLQPLVFRGRCVACMAFCSNRVWFILHPSSFILHPSSFILHPSSFILYLLLLAFLCAAHAHAQDAGQTQLEFANSLLERGFFKEAAEEYGAYLKAYPEGPHVGTAQYRLGESAYAAADYETALGAFDKALQGGADESARQRAAAGKGEVLYALKRPEEAAVVLMALTADDSPPEIRARALYYMGKIKVDAGETEGAVAFLKTLAEQVPESALVPYARYQLAFVYLMREELENAALEFSAVAGSGADARLRTESRFRAAETYDKIGWFTQAATAYGQLQEDFPGSEYAQQAERGLAWALYHTGKYAEALKAAETLLERGPDAPEAAGIRYLRANCLQQQKRYDEALGVYRAIREDFPGSEFANRSRYKIAWCLYLGGKNEEARDDAMAFLRDPGGQELVAEAAFLLGAIMVAQGDYENAYEEFRLVVEKYPQSEFGAEALYKAGECLAKLGRGSDAAALFEDFATKYPDNPLAGHAILRAGDAEFSAAAFGRAVAKYKKIIEGTTDAATVENALYRLAITYHNMKDHEASANAFLELAGKFPQSVHAPEVQFRMGEYYLRDGKDVVRAIEAYEASLAADPGGDFAGRAVRGMALARYTLKDLDAAAGLFLRLMTEFPSVTLNEDTYVWVGQRLFDQGKWADASMAFRALLDADGRYANPERVHFKIAECAEAAGETAEALGLFKAVVDAAPRSMSAVDARFRMAKLHEARGEMDEAFRLYEETAETNTGDTAARARFHLGELHEAKEDFDAAARSYMRVAFLLMHTELSPKALFRAAQCYERMSNPEQARKFYREIVEDYPDSEEAAEAKEELE